MTETTTGAFVELVDLSKTFGRHRAVDNISLDVREGELVTLLGGSGCGKTTTLRMIAGFERPGAGRICIGGTNVTGLAANRRGVGMVFQNYALFPTMTAAQNIAFGLKVRGVPAAQREKRVAEMLDLIHMGAFADRYPHQMSGGQQQRVALARALAVKPRVLLLDEPLSALDARIRVRLRAEIRAIQQALKITTIYVTHDQEEALSLSDRVVVMRDGRIEQAGTPAEIYNAPSTPFVGSFIGTLNVLRATVEDAGTGRVRVEGHVVHVRTPLAAANGATLTFSVRPEMIALQNGTAANNHLQGVVASVMFLGAIVRLLVRLGETEILVDTFNNPHLALPAAGDTVTLGFPPQACIVQESPEER